VTAPVLSPDDLGEIQARYDVATAYPGAVTIEQSQADVPALLAMVREQQVKLEAVAILAETWRYKGEFGWGAWQEDHGPDQEGHILDEVSSAIRAALTATEGPA
jgi:hypothetical protein